MNIGLLWEEGISEGWTDIYSISDFEYNCSNELYIHPVVAKGEKSRFAACLKTVQERVVTLDYLPFPITNEYEEILSGVIQFEISNTKGQIEKFTWRKDGSEEIEIVKYKITEPKRKPKIPQRMYDLLSCENISQDSPYYSTVKNAFEKAPKKISVTSTAFYRSPVIVKEALKRANGICQECGDKYRFISKVTKEPYLEVHHKKPLSEGGSDTMDNVKAICANCHRKIHFGLELQVG